MSDHPGSLWKRVSRRREWWAEQPRETSGTGGQHACAGPQQEALGELGAAASVTEAQVGWRAGDPEDPSQALRQKRVEWVRTCPHPPPSTDTPPIHLSLPPSLPPFVPPRSTPRSLPGHWPSSRPCGVGPDSLLLTTRSSVTRLSMGTWPRRPWKSLFGIMTLENPTISLVRAPSENAV